MSLRCRDATAIGIALPLLLAVCACRGSDSPPQQALPQPGAGQPRSTPLPMDDTEQQEFLKRMGPDEAGRRARQREVETLLPEPLKLVVLALDPIKPRPGEQPSSRLFHDYSILHSIDVVDPPAQKRLLDEVRKDFVDGGEAALCFLPRHGVRLISAAATVDLVLCYECSSARVYRGDGLKSLPIGPRGGRLLEAALEKSGFVRPAERARSAAGAN